MKILYATYSSAEHFLRSVELPEGAPGTITVSTRARYAEGETVVLEIGIPGMPNRVLLRTVARGAPPPDGEKELTFEVSAGEEHKRDFLVALASGKAKASWQRKHRRFPLRLPARFVAEGESVPLRGDAETEDVGSGGLFLRTSRELPEGTRVTVVLDPCDGSAEMEFSGRVVFTRKDDGPSGVGVQFDKLTGDEMKRLRRMIRDVKLSGKMVEWEDASDPV